MKAQIPLYSQIQQYVLEQIQTGALRPGDQVPPERKLADLFNVSRITAKNAIIGLVAEGYLFRHRGKGTFVSDQEAPAQAAQNAYASGIGAAAVGSEARAAIVAAAGALRAEARSGKPRRVGMIMPWMEFRYQSLLVSGVEYELSRRDCHLVFKRVDEQNGEEQSTLQQLLELPVDGLIIVASRSDFIHDALLRLLLEKFPIVFVEKYFRDYKVHAVHCDTEKVGYMMGEYLIRAGKRKVGYVSYPADYTAGVKERLFGFQSAAMAEGIPLVHLSLSLSVSPAIVTGMNQLHHQPVPAEIFDFLDSHPDLEAIATVDAHIAQFVGRACRQRGRQMTIVSCDEPSFAAECVMPEAYVDQSPVEMGIAAAELILDVMEQRQSEASIRRVEPKLVTLK
ncbi:GntR family transcriptional regulator [Paenibacillus sacheonensis]|uniref:GntR family transcriptional regulator n=1 Tax=Paenibacillus sacheonensis TaxID=742054 RepID=A0A7X5C1A6_9BACL|nr:DNA-binding LacI/PurR family transcriptional regulator/DNA-binding transcriptional regulator YhcF (GntR family) [Paenibacillus sacheonensis]NBC72572.1 GntR family transcriptional regulator [Paenibacillus sacheonensis]